MPLIALLVGVAIVVGGILALRLHAFLALLLGALAVALLTPAGSLEQGAARRAALPVLGEGQAEAPHLATVWVEYGPAQGGHVGQRLAALRVADDGRLRELGQLRVEDFQPRQVRGRDVTAARCTPAADATTGEPAAVPAWLPLAVDDLVLTLPATVAARKAAGASAIGRVMADIGQTCGSIGVLIALAALVGRLLLASGAADRIVRAMLAAVGEPRAPVAFVASGFLLGIPVFFDTVFYLLLPLAKALRRRTGGNFLLYVLAIVCGATMTHSLVPPTPGPLVAAQGFGVPVGLMILGGLAVGLATSSVGLLFAYAITRDWDIPLRDEPHAAAATDAPADDDPITSDPLASDPADDARLPSFFWAVLPIALPVLLISADTALASWLKLPGAAESAPWLKQLAPWVALVGNKEIAMILAATVALGVYVAQCGPTREDVAALVQAELASAGIVILITAAGGAFGGAMRDSGAADLAVGSLRVVDPLWVLPAAFFVTSLIRTAQGSATVAMITAVGMFAPLAESGELPYHPLYIALAIGCGSKPFAWMADSGFWVVTKMSGFSEWETLRSVTPMMAVMGFAGLLVVLLGAWLLPLV